MAVYYVVIDGEDISAGLTDVLTSITIKDGEGASDTASIDIDDADGQISLPRVGAKIEIGLGWEEDGGAVAMFQGKVDDVKSSGGRGQGRMLNIGAKSADTRSKLKQNDEKHKDKSKLGEVVKDWGKEAGLTDFLIHAELEAIERDYWSMEGESFLAWGARTARELGANFKVVGDRAVMTPRSTGKSASGKDLPKITAEWGDNLINWSMSPVMSRDEFKKFETRYYDPKEAKWKSETFEAREVGQGIEASKSRRFSSSDKDSAKREAESEGKESDREKGGGSVDIHGNPTAQAEAECELVGARPGVDGTYRIVTATHKYSRSGGYITTLELKQPKGEAGKDKRPSKKAAPAKKTTTSKNNSAVNMTGGGGNSGVG